MLLLTPLRPGTIRDLFSPKRNAPKGKPTRDPLSLPTTPAQCVHIAWYERADGEGGDYIRCVNDAVEAQHGWLCLNHQPVFLKPRGYVYRDKDAEVVAGIVAYEHRALRHIEREVVRIGPKTRITYARPQVDLL